MGKRALEAAALRTGTTLELEWKPFMLDPSLPRGGVDKMDHYSKKFGPRAKAMLTDPNNMLAQRGKPLGIDFQYHPGSKVFNTMACHKVVQLALAKGGLALQNRLMEVMFRRYFTEGKNLGEEAELTEAAVESGLSAEDVATAVKDPSIDRTVVGEIEEAMTAVSGVPHFIFPSGQQISGGESVDSFARALQACK